MPQARLSFHYAEESKSTGMTSMSGLATYWAEADQIVHSEFRDGNVQRATSSCGCLGSRFSIYLMVWSG